MWTCISYIYTHTHTRISDYCCGIQMISEDYCWHTGAFFVAHSLPQMVCLMVSTCTSGKCSTHVEVKDLIYKNMWRMWSFYISAFTELIVFSQSFVMLIELVMLSLNNFTEVFWISNVLSLWVVMLSKLKHFSVCPSEILFGFSDLLTVFVLFLFGCLLLCLSSLSFVSLQ